jgi:hypothetical protein
MRAQPFRASLQTQHALQASELAAAINDALKKARIGPGDYAPELTAPQGPSTAGGVQAMQHLRLVPGQAGQPTLVVGHANQTEKTAELRTYEYVDAVHQQRFHRPLALDRRAYDDLLGLAKQLFGALGLQTTVVGPPPDLGTDRRPTVDLLRARTIVVRVAVVASMVVALFALAWVVFFRAS